MVVSLENVSEFIVMIDGNTIPGATVVDNKFSVSYPLTTTSVGNHTVTVTLKDNKGKSGSSSVTFEVLPEAIEL